MAGLCEIGGGYLVWLWLREDKPSWYALVGAGVLVLLGIIPTFQPTHFGRVYATYGGIFIVLSILWGWQVDKIAPDKFDIIGGIRRFAWRNDHHVLASGLRRKFAARQFTQERDDDSRCALYLSALGRSFFIPHEISAVHHIRYSDSEGHHIRLLKT